MSDQPVTKVVVDTPGVSVTVEAAEPLGEVRRHVMEMFHEAGGWPHPKPGGATGFHTETRPVPDQYGLETT